MCKVKVIHLSRTINGCPERRPIPIRSFNNTLIGILVVRYIESQQVMKGIGVCQARLGGFEVLIATDLLK